MLPSSTVFRPDEMSHRKFNHNTNGRTEKGNTNKETNNNNNNAPPPPLHASKQTETKTKTNQTTTTTTTTTTNNNKDITQDIIAAASVTGNVEDVRVIGRDDYQSILPCLLLANGHSGVEGNGVFQSSLCPVGMVPMVNPTPWSAEGQN